MARYEKMDPYCNIHRARLAADWPAGDLGKPYGVGLNADGKVVKGKGAGTHVRHILILTKARKANERVDIQNAGEIADWAPTAGVPGSDFGVAGTEYFADATTGVITSTPSDGCSYVGTTTDDPSQLILNVQPHSLAVDVP